MTRTTIAVVLLGAAALCFLLALASITGDDFVINEPAARNAGFFLTTIALIVERMR